MRSKSVSLKVPWPLIDEMKLICHEEKFENDSACWIAAGMFFCLMLRRRNYVREIANSNPKRQSFLMEQMFGIPHHDVDAMMKYLEKLPAKNYR